MKNKLENLINVEQDYGRPNKDNQSLVKNACIFKMLADLMERIWPDENELRNHIESK